MDENNILYTKFHLITRPPSGLPTAWVDNDGFSSGAQWLWRGKFQPTRPDGEETGWLGLGLGPANY